MIESLPYQGIGRQVMHKNNDVEVPIYNRDIEIHPDFKVIHIRDSGQSPNEIYIGRADNGDVPLDFVRGYWGSPVVKNKQCPGCQGIHSENGGTLSCYSQYLNWRLETDSVFKSRFLELKDKILVCYCCPKDGFQNKILCHGQIMVRKLNEINGANITDDG